MPLCCRRAELGSTGPAEYGGCTVHDWAATIGGGTDGVVGVHWPTYDRMPCFWEPHDIFRLLSRPREVLRDLLSWVFRPRKDSRCPSVSLTRLRELLRGGGSTAAIFTAGDSCPEDTMSGALERRGESERLTPVPRGTTLRKEDVAGIRSLGLNSPDASSALEAPREPESAAGSYGDLDPAREAESGGECRTGVEHTDA